MAGVGVAGRRAAWYPWALLIGGAAVSVTANSLHAVVAADADVPGLLAAAVAAVPPVVLLAITHLTVVLTRTTERAAPDVLAAVGLADTEQGADPQRPGGSAPAATPGSASEPRGTVVTGLADPGGAGVGGADRRAVAAGLRDAGWSNKKIAAAVRVHPSTVGRWFPGAHHPGEPGRDPVSAGEGAMS